MNCAEFEACLHTYVDGELEVGELLAANAHLAQCAECQARVERERQFRQLLARQPRESAPAELRAVIHGRLQQSARRTVLRRWLIAPAALAAAAVLLVVLLPGNGRAPLVTDLVNKHITYAQIEQPAEFASADPRAVQDWLRQRAGLRVTVSDYSMSGIRLVGARIAETDERKAAYVLYEKGHTLMSVFTIPVSARAASIEGKRVSYRGHEYTTLERKGYRTVSWSDGHTVFGLVSMLDYDALLECADKLRADRAAQLGA
jgi:mycothiol system anti-sigma-R factor